MLSLSSARLEVMVYYCIAGFGSLLLEWGKVRVLEHFSRSPLYWLHDEVLYYASGLEISAQYVDEKLLHAHVESILATSDISGCASMQLTAELRVSYSFIHVSQILNMCKYDWFPDQAQFARAPIIFK